MKIALDYDNTYTLNPRAWEHVLGVLRFQFGTDIRTVTLRSGERDEILDFPGGMYGEALPIIYCDGRPKREVCRELGWEPDVWIDDAPESIVSGSTLTPEQIEEWRKRAV